MSTDDKNSDVSTGPLLSEFPSHTYDEWRDAAEALLKGKPFEKLLVTPTYEGFDLQPIYMREDLEDLGHSGNPPGMGDQVRGSRIEGFLTEGWLVSQELSEATPELLNAELLHALMNGQNEANIWFDRVTRSGSALAEGNLREVGICGVSLADLCDMDALFKDVELSAISTFLRGGIAGPAVLAQFVALAHKRGIDLSSLRGALDMDPLSWALETGGLGKSLSAVQSEMADVVRYASEKLPQFHVLTLSGHAVHNGGGSSTQEIAAILSSAVWTLESLREAGIEPVHVLPHLRLSVSIGSNYFLEISKLRALRVVWNRLLDAYDIPEHGRKLHIHARTGLWNKTLFDPFVNMLRTTVEAFAAVVGGCDSLHVGPFDEIIREADRFSRRIARNTHAILAEECGLTQVLDPAGGSYAVESLTDEMGRIAWSDFQKIEEAGGIVRALEESRLQSAVADVKAMRVKNIHRRKDVIVGTNTYPNSTEELLKPHATNRTESVRNRMDELRARLEKRDSAKVEQALAGIQVKSGTDRVEAMVAAAESGATVSEIFKALDNGEPGIFSVEPIGLQRAAEDYEQLRMAAMALSAAGKAPVIHQLNMGPSRKYRTRADWTSAFFQVGGFRMLNQDDYADSAAAIEALNSSGAAIAVLVSDDDAYKENSLDWVKQLKSAFPDCQFLLAGAPGENEAALREAGLHDFVHVRVNAYQANRELLKTLGAQL